MRLCPVDFAVIIAPMSNGLNSFRHEAMNTTFEVVIYGQDEEYAFQAANAVFRELYSLETKLSKFIEYSDPGRIKVLKPGQSTKISPETMNCLLAALWVFRETDGAYDISLGKGLEHLLLDPGNMSAGIAIDGYEGLELDLGGIGKGHALDAAADLIAGWGIENALLSGGASTVLAVGKNGDKEWSLGVYGEPVLLKDTAISGSGKDIQGEHVIDPRTGLAAIGHDKAWAICPSAAAADALSTAFMVMDTALVEEFCRKHEGIKGLVLSNSGQLLRFG